MLCMRDYKAIISKLSKILVLAADPKKGKEKTDYMKGVITCYGLSHPQNREIFKQFYKENLKDYSDDELRELGFSLLQENGYDEKFQGIECLVKTIPSFNPDHLHQLEPIIDQYVYDWGTCDNLSGHLLTKVMIKNSACISTIHTWKDSSSWRQRAACVSFLHFARRNTQIETIMDICESAVKNPYRFTQLGVGWVLRDVSVHNKKLVIDFLNTHEDDFTREAIRYATEKMTPTDKKKVHACQKMTRKNKKSEE